MTETQSLTQVDAELLRTRAELMRGVRLLDAVIEAHADVSEAGSWSGAGNGSVSGGKNASNSNASHELGISDRTGAVAISAARGYMRRQLEVAASKGPALRKGMRVVHGILDEMEKTLKRAVPVALDSEMREKLAKADADDRDYRSRHSHKS